MIYHHSLWFCKMTYSFYLQEELELHLQTVILEEWIRDCLQKLTSAVMPMDPSISLSISLMCEWMGKKDNESDVKLSKVWESYHVLKLLKMLGSYKLKIDKDMKRYQYYHLSKFGLVLCRLVTVDIAENLLCIYFYSSSPTLCNHTSFLLYFFS